MTQATAPLDGVRVLDLTQFLAGPYCTQILGDLGAEVIKIEPPAGDSSRAVPPHYIAGDSAYYLSTNRNKQTAVLDLRDDSDREVLHELLRTCDIVVENYRPGVMDRLGFAYESISAMRPEIVWCSISGFGQDGPYRDRPAYDMIVQALSGGMRLTGERDGKPVRAGVPLGDLAAGMYGVIGILAALDRRRRTGEGDYVDIAMLDCQVSMLSYQAAYHLHSGAVPGPQGRGHDAIPTYRCFTAGDGIDVAVTANTERMWISLCEVLDRGELVSDPRFATPGDRLRSRDVLEPILEEAFLARSADEWVDLLEEAGIPVAPVNTLDRALRDPQVCHRGMVLDLAGDAPGERARVVGSPLRFARASGRPQRYPPHLDQDAELIRAIAGEAPDDAR